MTFRKHAIRSAVGAALAGAALMSATPAVACSGDGSGTIGSICMTAANFCPRGTLEAKGTLLSIHEDTILFSVLGCNYGGDCRSTFALPDLRGRSPIGMGQGPGLSPVALGQRRGNEVTTLDAANMPSHNHGQADGAAAQTPALAPASRGNSVPFSNVPPQLGITYCVVTQGIYPPRS